MILWLSFSVYLFLLLMVNQLLKKGDRRGPVGWCLTYGMAAVMLFLLLFRGDFGVDWDSYKAAYYEGGDILELLVGERWLPLNLEPGYQLYSGLLRLFNFGNNWLPVGLFLFCIFLIFRSLQRNNIDPIPPVVLYALMVYPHFFGQMRMAFVYSLGSVLILYLVRPLKTKVLIGLSAASVQYIGLFYLLLPFLKNVFQERILRLALFSRQDVSRWPSRAYLATIIVLGLSASFVGGEYILEQVVDLFQIVPESSIALKFISYYERREDVQVSYAGFSILFFILLLSFSLSGRVNRSGYGQRELISCQVYLFLGLMAFLAFNQFPILSHRLVSMLIIPAFFLFVSTFSILSGRFGVLIALVYAYATLNFSKVAIALGPYYF